MPMQNNDIKNATMADLYLGLSIQILSAQPKYQECTNEISRSNSLKLGCSTNSQREKFNRFVFGSLPHSYRIKTLRLDHALNYPLKTYSILLN
jgi:hypothetical protein